MLEAEKIAYVFTDPPYNVRIEGHVSGKGSIRHPEFAMASGEMSGSQFSKFLKNGFHLMARHSRDGAIHCVCMDWRHIAEMMEAGNAAYTELKNVCVWVKSNGGMGTFYRSRHELVFVWKNGRGPHVNNFELGQFGRSRSNVWEYDGVNPKGRPKNSRNLKTIIQQALTAAVTVREGQSTRRVSKLEGIVLRQVETALKGNEKAALAVLRMAGQVDLLEGSETNSDSELTAMEQRILDDLLQDAGKTKTARRLKPNGR